MTRSTGLRTARRALLSVLSVALVLGTVICDVPAYAAGGTVTFDEGLVPDGTRLDSQYRFVGGADGLRFGSAADLGWSTETDCGGSGVGDYRPILRQMSGNGSFSFYAHSGARVTESVTNNCASGEFGTGAILIRCTVQCLSMSGFIGLGNETSTPPVNPNGITFVASGYAADGTLLDTQNVVIDSPGALNGFALDPAGDAAMTFVKLRSTGLLNSVIADDLTYAPDPAALPAYTVTATSVVQNAFLSPGGTATLTYSVVRSNGSDGELTPQATDLPPGVSASFSPTSFPGTSDGSLTLTLTADSNAAASGATSATVGLTGPPTAGTGNDVGFVVHVDPTLQNPPALVNPVAPWCTRQAREVLIALRDGQANPGSAIVTATAGDPGWNATVLNSPVPINGAGIGTAVVVFEHATNSSPNTSQITVSAHPPGRPNDLSSTVTTVSSPSPKIFEPSVSAVPPLGDHQAGSTVHATGFGFCAGSQVRFENDKAIVPLVGTQPADNQLDTSGATDRQNIDVATPRLATSGFFNYNAGFGWSIGPKLTTTGFRNSAGFPFGNYPVSDLTYQDMTDAFGEDQTYLHIDLCFPFGCTIKVRDPVAMIYTAIVRAETVGTQGSGHCYGMSLTAALMRAGLLSLSSYPPQGAQNAWHLTGEAGPSPALARTIQVNHLKQFGLTFLDYWIKQHVLNAVADGNDIVAQVRSAIDHHGGALITIADHGGGHVVLAHSIEDVSSTEHWIDLYDPNYPHASAEDTDFTGAMHEASLNGSRIHIVGSTWTLVFPDATVWSGPTQGLVGGSIIVVPLDEAKKSQLLPSLLSIPQLLTQIIGFGSTSGTSTVTPGAGVVPYDPMNQTTSAGLFVAPPAAKRGAAKAGGQAATVDSPSADTVTTFASGQGTVVAGTLKTSGGSTTQASLADHGVTLSPDATTPLQLLVAREVDGAPIQTTVSGSAPAGDALTLAQTDAGLRVASTKAMTLTLAIDASGGRGSRPTRTVSLTLPAGKDLTVASAQLASTGPSLQVKVGGASRTLAVATPRLGTATIKGLSATRSGGKVSVVAKVRLLSRRGSGQVVMTLTNASGDVVAQKTIPVTRANLRHGKTVTYRWSATLAGKLIAHVAGSITPTVGSAGMVSAAKSVKVGR